MTTLTMDTPMAIPAVETAPEISPTEEQIRTCISIVHRWFALGSGSVAIESCPNIRDAHELNILEGHLRTMGEEYITHIRGILTGKRLPDTAEYLASLRRPSTSDQSSVNSLSH